MFALFMEINSLRLNTRWVSIRFSGVNVYSIFSKRILAFLGGLGRSIVLAPLEISSLLKRERVTEAFFSSTQNQTASLAPIAASLASARWVLVNQRKKSISTNILFPSILVSLVSIMTLPLTLIFVFKFVVVPTSSGDTFVERARAAALSIDELLRTFGYWVAAWMFLRCHRVQILIMSNDHNSINRAFCSAGNRVGAETIYVQHAPVSDLFPRLIFSRAFLDGRFAADIYAAKPSKTIVEVLGASRYDHKFQRSPSVDTEAKVVSLCVNKIDRHQHFNAYCAAFKRRGWTVLVRPHPGMTDGDLSFLPADVTIDRSELAEHLRKVRFLVAGSSGVLLDAFMAGVVPLLAKDLSIAPDYYGFLDQKAVFSLQFEAIDEFDREFRTYKLAAIESGMRHFNAAIGTNHAYSTHEEVCKRIKARCQALYDESKFP